MSKAPGSFVRSAISLSTRCQVLSLGIERVILSPQIIRIGPKIKKNSRGIDSLGLLLDHSVWIVMYLIPAEQVSCIYFFHNIIQRRIVPIGDDAAAHFLELLEIVDNLRTEERTSVF